jgi:hypothetical protein
MRTQPRCCRGARIAHRPHPDENGAQNCASWSWQVYAVGVRNTYELLARIELGATLAAGLIVVAGLAAAAWASRSWVEAWWPAPRSVSASCSGVSGRRRRTDAARLRTPRADACSSSHA